MYCLSLQPAVISKKDGNRVIFITVTLLLVKRKLDVMFISVFNKLDAQNLFHNKFYFMPLHVSSTCAHHQEVAVRPPIGVMIPEAV